jgi:hypothetical protein
MSKSNCIHCSYCTPELCSTVQRCSYNISVWRRLRKAIGQVRVCVLAFVLFTVPLCNKFPPQRRFIVTQGQRWKAKYAHKRLQVLTRTIFPRSPYTLHYTKHRNNNNNINNNNNNNILVCMYIFILEVSVVRLAFCATYTTYIYICGIRIIYIYI